ncbi:hypothetical protein NQD34_014552 [Periophthalmus magnuspinnatus]|nr:hypothetical protein NQD34_014552 [Periophthalmus magnuspinnatus]
MQVRSLVLLWVFFVQGERVENKQSVFLHCVPPKDQIVPGKNLTVDCQINSTAHHDTCNFSNMRCFYNGKLNTPCGPKKQENANNINVTVEVYNVTTSGNYTFKIHTDCGVSLMFTFEAKVTNTKLDPGRSISTDNPPDKTNIIPLVLGSLGVLVIVAVACVTLVIITRRRKDKSTSPEYQPSNTNEDPELTVV